MFLLVHGEIHSNKEEVCLADNQLFVTPPIKYSVSKPIMPCNNVSMSIIIIIIIIFSRFLYSAFHIVSMRFTTDGELFWAAYEGAYCSRAAYNHEELIC